ncbi:MAG: peptidoglycan-binding domain-containing protein [Candidatus Pacebacteria bacterium]|nr:peptidoglycan-binding domain-containing protein [Candidatus Paceibacterota bacterium]
MSTSTRAGFPVKRFGIVLAAALFVLAGVAVPAAHAATPVVLSAKITSGTTVAVSFSEPVATSMGNYGNFTGALSGRSLIGFSGSGTNTVTLTFSGSAFPGGSSGGLTVSNGTVSVSDGSSFTNGGVSVVDGRAPSLVAFSVSSGDGQTALGTVGNQLNISFTMSASILSERVTLNGHTLYPSGGGAGPYTAGYSLTAQDASYSQIPIVVTYTDQYGNTGTVNFTFNNSATIATQGSSGTTIPIISSITSNARSTGWLKVGDSITFTLLPYAAAPNAQVTGSYNGVSLVWSTNNGGVTYTGTYTVASGNSDQQIPIQIGGVTLTDQYGTVSAPVSGTDVAKMISANSPYIYESVPIPSATGNLNPSYSFVSNKDGTLTYGGDCVSPASSAVRGNNTITFINLTAGLHNNCTVTVTDNAGNVGNILRVSAFTILGAGGTGTSVNTTTTPTTGTTSTGSTTATTYTFTSFLSTGSTGTQVTNLQNYLTQKGFYSGPVTGYFGSLTAVAVAKYQTAHGISAVGYVGPGTRAALNIGE